MDNQLIKLNLHFLCREKYFLKMYKLAQNASHSSSEACFKLYAAIALVLQGQTQDGIAELTLLENHEEINLAVHIAKIYAYKKSTSVKREVISNSEIRLKEERKTANNISLYYAALFLTLAEKFEKASEYLNRSIKKDPNFIDALILNGWNNLLLKLENLDVSVSDNFELATKKSSKNAEALLGWAKYNYYTKKFDASNLLLDKVIIDYSNEVVPLIEKMRNEFAMKKWDSVMDLLETILAIDELNLEAIKVKIFLSLGKNGDAIEGADLLNRFFSLLENEEISNGIQFYMTAKLFSRICDRSSSALMQVYKFAQFASEMFPNNVEYLCEVGYQCFLQGKLKEAQSFYKAASRIDSNSITALCGLTVCHLAENRPSKQVEEQLELLMEIQGSKHFPVLYLLSAKLANGDPKTAVAYLNRAYELKLKQSNKYPYSLQYISELDPDFLLEIYIQFKQYLPHKPFVITGTLLYNEDMSHENLQKCMNLLELVVDTCPGILSAVYELAKLKFVSGFASEAQMLADKILELDSIHAGAHILLAQIHLQKKLYVKASQYLDACLSYNFKVKDCPMYNLVLGIVSKLRGNTEDALSSLRCSFDNLNSNKTNKSKNNDLINVVDKATLYLELIDLLNETGQKVDSEKLMQEAIQELTYTTENGRLIIAKAEQVLKSKDPDRALELLLDIKPEDPYYFQAKSKMANIYLKEKNNRAMFKECFRDIVSHKPNADSHAIMGDVYMDIFEPEYAVESYKNALKSSPKSVQLIKKLGIALMKTHEFGELMKHFEHSIILLPDSEELKFEYYEILIRLKQFDKVDKMITSDLNQPLNKEKNLANLQRRVKYLLLQIKARELMVNGGNVNALLNEARELQTSVVRQIEIDARGDLQEERQRLADILCRIAASRTTRDPISLYTEALANVPRDTNILMALARLYAETNNPEKCEQTCAILLNTDPNNESAAVMMADLAYRRVDLESAQRHLENIIAANPVSWEALSQLVEVAYRRGKLSDIEVHLENAKNALQKNLLGGYWYAAGLYALYSYKPNSALRQLNAARTDQKYKVKASKVMCLTCLTHADDDSAISQEFLKHDGDISDTRTLAIRTAERLLLDLPAQERKPLHALVRLASDHRSYAETVVQDLSAYEWNEEPYAVLALSNAYNQLKQPARTKALLKKAFSEISWTPEKADGLERCWLELADIYSNSSSKIDSTKEVIVKILKHNAACVPAHRIAGQIAEKEQNYKNAALSYENAWTHGARQDLSLGYKYAQVSLKLRKYPQAISVCRHIIAERPDYPKIRKEILDKAVANLKT